MLAGPKSSDNLQYWEGIVEGPDDTPWESALLRLSFKFEDNYPITPPKVKWISKVYHPNFYINGNICLDILRPDSWKVSYDVVLIIKSIQSLLDAPNPDSPANSEAADLYKHNRPAYDEKVRKIAEASLEED